LLDGLAPPPPYRWVAPPSNLAASNEKPFSAKFTINKQGASYRAGVFSTRDGQVQLVLPTGALPVEAGQKSVLLTITPLAPSAVGAPPKGQEFAGNVYRIDGVYQPSGQEVGALSGSQSRLLLVYPESAGLVSPTHTIYASPDGKSWTKLTTGDSAAQQQAAVTISSLGYFAVTQSQNQSALSSLSGRLVAILIYVIAGLAIVSLIVVRVISDRRRIQAQKAPKGRSRK
jgi:hypothetical protein